MGFGKTKYDVEEKGLDPKKPHNKLGTDGKLDSEKNESDPALVEDLPKSKDDSQNPLPKPVEFEQTSPKKVKEVEEVKENPKQEETSKPKKKAPAKKRTTTKKKTSPAKKKKASPTKKKTVTKSKKKTAKSNS